MNLKIENPRRRSTLASWLLLSAAVLMCGSTALGQTLTTVVGTLTDAFGNGASAKLTATCSIRAGAVFVNGAYTVVGTSAAHALPVVNGAFSASLVPTDTTYPATYHELRCHFPLQAADGRNCEGNASLVSQGVCVVGPGDLVPLYLSVPTSGSFVNLKDIYRSTKPAGTVATWGGLLGAAVTWGQLLQPR
jgi:hypothetical protein